MQVNNLYQYGHHISRLCLCFVFEAAVNTLPHTATLIIPFNVDLERAY